MASGRAEIANKGKRRSIFLSEKLCRLLKSYLKRNGITAGPVFVTRSGRPLDRSNIWRDMKVLCKSAGVKPDKVFPHNLRHLFARTFYTQEKDLSRLADILGHTSVNTTRIYTAESGLIHARQMERMGLIVTLFLLCGSFDASKAIDVLKLYRRRREKARDTNENRKQILFPGMTNRPDRPPVARPNFLCLK